MLFISFVIASRKNILLSVIYVFLYVRLRFSRRWLWNMKSSGMLDRLALVRTIIVLLLLYYSTTIVFIRRVLRLLVTANIPSSLILVTLMMEAIRSSETSVLTRDTASHLRIRHSLLHSLLFPPILLNSRNIMQFLTRLFLISLK
jgi:hypothetical protein